jgi:hypothetical protein
MEERTLEMSMMQKTHEIHMIHNWDLIEEIHMIDV